LLGHFALTLGKLGRALGVAVALTVPFVAGSSLEASPATMPTGSSRILRVQHTVGSSLSRDFSRFVAQPPKLLYHGGPVEHTNKNYAIY
jgi:hypothetical protein